MNSKPVLEKCPTTLKHHSRFVSFQKKLRGYTIGKLYFKIGDYLTAVNHVSQYLSAVSNNATAYRFLGQCYEKLKKPDKTLAAYQRSLELDKKQSDLLVEVCKLLQMDEISGITSAKARYWYELAESRNIQHDAVLNLKLKYLQGAQNGTDNVHTIQEVILKEVKSRPFDVGLRIRLLRHFLDQNLPEDAFKYAYDIEMKQNGHFWNSADWYVVVAEVLAKYKAVPAIATKINQNWPFWLLSIISLERQVYLNLSVSPSDSSSISINLTDAANYLSEFDQTLNKVAGLNVFPDQERELGSQFLYHFRGQLCLHAATLLFKREMSATRRNQWQETTRNALPLLLLAYNCGIVDSTQLWLRNYSETTKHLIHVWSIQSAFRCCQAGRTLISCVEVQANEGNTAIDNLRRIRNDSNSLWSSCDEILTEIRRSTTDADWRKRAYRLLFNNNDQHVNTSYFVSCGALEKPTYDWPYVSDLEAYEETSQQLQPSSLSHLVYLALGFDMTTTNTAQTTISSDVKCLVFNDLSFSISNLVNCGAETLNQLDVDTFLYAATIQAKRNIEVEKTYLNSGRATEGNATRPKILPYANMAYRLCSEEQENWWTAAYKVGHIDKSFLGGRLT